MNEPQPAAVRPGSRWKAYLQLLRLPNVFTAMADILLGYLFTHASLEPLVIFLLLLGSSCCLYLAGMVLNDLFDVDQDARERPHRPIPSGRIAITTVRLLGAELLLVGIGLGWMASFLSGQLTSGIVASLLAVCVVLYDRWLKRTPLGPLGMGACRFLNVLLGMSAAEDAWHQLHWVVAAGVGIYIVGVTWFARTEARTSNRWQLAMAIAVMLCGIGLLASIPHWASPSLPLVSVPIYVDQRWYLMWGVLAALISWRAILAVAEPIPVRVQAAVKQCILSLIMLDAVACFSVRGPTYAILIVLLLLPTMTLGRWIYST